MWLELSDGRRRISQNGQNQSIPALSIEEVRWLKAEFPDEARLFLIVIRDCIRLRSKITGSFGNREPSFLLVSDEEQPTFL